MIASVFGFIRDFSTERNNIVYFRGRKIPYEFKKQARACHSGEKFGPENRQELNE